MAKILQISRRIAWIIATYPKSSELNQPNDHEIRVSTSFLLPFFYVTSNSLKLSHSLSE